MQQSNKYNVCMIHEWCFWVKILELKSNKIHTSSTDCNWHYTWHNYVLSCTCTFMKNNPTILFVSNISCIAFIILKVFMYTQNIDVGLFFILKYDNDVKATRKFWWIKESAA